MSIYIDHTYLVRVITPVFDHSTDGYLGTRSVIEEAFSTYEEAEQYCWENYNSHEVGDTDEIHAVVSVDINYDIDGATYGHEYKLSELNGNSQYYGPVDPNAPF